MTPLMLMTLISLAPFPILVIALFTGRWFKPNQPAAAIAFVKDDRFR